MSVRLNPLSTVKGKQNSCEMCGSSALLCCAHCRVTFYCSAAHQAVDWSGIHEKICQLLGALRSLKPTLGSEDERQRRNLTVQMSQHALIDLCRNESSKHLVKGQFELAIPGALQALRFSMQVYGAGRIELVPAYLLLAESNLGLKRFKIAEEFLLYANWSVLKTPECANELKSQLYRNFGKLYAAQGRFEDALKQLSCDVYYSALESGPEHIDTAGGYFYMADVFLKQRRLEDALAFYDKCVDIFYKFLINLKNRPDESIHDYLSESHISEAAEMLSAIVAIRKKHLGQSHLASGEASYALGILKAIVGNHREARFAYEFALSIYKTRLGADNEATSAVRRALEKLKKEEKNQIKEQNEREKQENKTQENQNEQTQEEQTNNINNEEEAEAEGEGETEADGDDVEAESELVSLPVVSHARVLSTAEADAGDELIEQEEKELQQALEEEEVTKQQPETNEQTDENE
jgi:hypothetical protein